MFSRRRAASSPASKQPPSAAASLAASQAFIRNQGSNAALSSAAAAAALRTHATIPTPVGDTITKRMARKGSTSSVGTGSQQAAGLRRHSSSGSMTERSFRTPSPNRSNPVAEAHHNAPPVPAVPNEVPSEGVVHRLASSLEPPFRGGSPAKRGGGQGASLDSGVMTPAGRGQGHTGRVMSLSQVPEADPENSPRSINFSRPISPQATSPSRSVASSRAGQSGWFVAPVVNSEQTFRETGKPRPKTSDGVSAQDLHVQQSVQNATDKQVSNKKAKISQEVEGARLATENMRAKSSGSNAQSTQAPAAQSTSYEPQSIDPKSPLAVYDPSTRTFIPKQQAMARFRELNQYDGEPLQQYVVEHAPPQRPDSPPQRPVSKEEPSPARHAHTPPHHVSPPRLESPTPQPRERSPSPDTQSAIEREQSPITQHVVERPPTPPSGSQTRADALLARQSSEDFSAADIQPTADANTSRKLESVPTDVSYELPESPSSPRVASNQEGPYPRLAKSVTQTPASTLSIGGRGGVRGERTDSLSPPRNAHFATVAVELANGIKHQPPPRSVSPAKSALKSSPSVSRRNSSPIANNGQSVGRGAPSETSDTMSEDGTKKKKKNVRVSFDEDPVIAGTSAYAEVDTPSLPTGLGTSRWSSAIQEQDLDDVMKPRPALPSFGSIRDRNRRHEDGDVPEKVTETVSSSLSTSVGSIGEPLVTSSDHAIAGIITQDFASKKSPSTSDLHVPSALEPLPPEVTSVEGTGYVSDSDQSDTRWVETAIQESSKAEPKFEPEAPLDELEPKTLTTPIEISTPQVPEVPSIAIQPASPGPVEKPEPKFQRPFVPGGWSDDEESETESNEEAHLSQDNATPTITLAPQDRLPVVQDQPDDSSDDSSSIYSDAYEDLSDDKDGGFASIDAVVESPIISPPSGLMSSRHADTGPAEALPKSSLSNEYSEYTRKENSPAASVLSQVQDISQKQIHKKVPNEQPLLVESVDTLVLPPPKPKQMRATTEGKAQVDPIPTTSKSVQVSQPKQPSAQPRKSAMKKLAPLPQKMTAPGTHIRKTMRGSTGSPAVAASETQMRKSMRTSEPVGAASRGQSGLAASRHSMPSIDTKPPKGTLQKKHIPAAVAARKVRPQTASGSVATKPVAPVPTYDSDSDASVSSFVRQRPRTSLVEGGRYTMRSSMRTGPSVGPAPTMKATPTMRPTSLPPATSPSPAFRKSMRPSPPPEPVKGGGLRSSKFSIRSLSPTGRFGGMRQSVDDTLSLPTQTSSPKRISAKIPTFGKSSKSKAPAMNALKPRFKSRFADSSDEDEDDRSRRFQSRFADSDSDNDFELPAGLAPVRGIPQKPGEEDRESTDLEDEESDNEPSPPVLAPKEVEKSEPPMTNGNANAGPGAFSTGSLRKSKHAPKLSSLESGKKSKSKRSFFGLGKKKTRSQPTEPDTQNMESTDIPLPSEQRNRPLTPIGEDKAIEAGIPSSRSPKLQRRSMPQWGRSTSDSWPLPQPPKIGEEARPQSSDGVLPKRASLGPTLSKQHSSTTSEAKNGVDPKTGKEVSFGRSGKKKKFQGLRRVFGLND
ncbi:hypothetical protein K469DRAFT_302538 [Zopfia rhizophila CBS 207.26]|uniref:Uncharacterized protein n=1 Tax=Zopfia rhizophila CBS 207.26 TaxID=1314779 RepID=A0A6A6DJU8_9PEZI|nr:hypothetical protein K469DRAFT_302538 [Zopfia rhizophila CBS 207.26]